MKPRKKASNKTQSKSAKLGASRNRASTGRTLGILTLILILNLIAYANSFDASWHFDDLANIVVNRDVQITDLSWKSLRSTMTTQIGGTRPIPYLTFGINHYFSGLNVGPYHDVNFVIHILNAFLVFAMVFLILKHSQSDVPLSHLQIFSFFVAALWSTNPLQTQSVTYIVQRMNLLATLFFLLSLLFYIRWRSPETKHNPIGNVAGCVACALLAFASKENSFTLPVVLLLYEIYFVRKFRWPKFKVTTALLYFLIVIGLVGFVAYRYKVVEKIQVGYAHRPFSMGERILTQPRIIVYHLSQLLLPLPSRLALHHEFDKSHSLLSPPTTLLSFLFIGIALGISILWRQRRPVISFFILWFFATLAIESTILPLELIFEHRVYLPSIGFFVVLLFPFLEYTQALSQKRIVTLSILCGLLICSAYLSYERNKVWKDDVTLWQDNAQKYPESFRAQNNLGTAYMESGQVALAEKAFREAIRLNPKFPGARTNLALLYLREGRLDEATQWVKEIDEKDLNFLPDVYFNLGVIYAKQGNLEKAIESYRNAIARKRNFAEAYFNLALVYLRTKAYSEARTYFNEFLRSHNGDPNSPYVIEARNQLSQLNKE